VVTWSQLGIHSCPIILYNVNGFYTPLLEWINTAVKFGFIRPANASIIAEAKTLDEVEEKLGKYTQPDSIYRLDWTVQSPMESKKTLNGTYFET
jgi:predicted Rossmann-fold nucleotide-binding protein